MTNLNIIFIGPFSFPLGLASTKRRRYMVDYINDHGIHSHVLSTHYNRISSINNSISGRYGNCQYYDISIFFSLKKIRKYYLEGINTLRNWYDPSKNNMLIFSTGISVEDYFFFIYAKKIGYKILFDQVETSLKTNGRNFSLKKRIHNILNDIVTNKAYKHTKASFVISSSLWSQNRDKYPNMKLCLLPNSTPVLYSGFSSGHEYLNLLYSGTFAHKDGVGFLIEGVKIALQRGVKCKLTLTGIGNEEDMELLEEIKNSDNFIYKGYVTDRELKQIMQNSDLLCMTRTNSLFANYGFPFKLSEYLSTGNLVLATKVSDVTNYLIDKESALLIDPENSTQIAEAIEFVDNNREKAIGIGLKGLRVMKEFFSIESVGNKFISFLNSIN